MLLILLFAVVNAVHEENCGVVTPGVREAPWDAGIYMADSKSEGGDELPPLNWLCSASLVSNKIVLTAAHKVYIEQNKVMPLPPESFTVGLGALSKSLSPPVDSFTQLSQVISVHLAPGFQNRGTSSFVEDYADDIAVVIVDRPFEFTPSIQPICLDFNYEFEQSQLRDGAEGKAAGWISLSLINDEDLDFPPAKKLHHVPLTDCLDDKLTESLDINTVKILALAVSDKICFGAKQNASALCESDGDTGTGVAYPAVINGTKRFYLRGVFSGPLDKNKDCTLTNYMFTPLLRHESFIKKYVNVESDNIPPVSLQCSLPPYPEHGTFVLNTTLVVNASGGGDYELETLTVSCQQGYGVRGAAAVTCFNGLWPRSFPKCVRMCPLKPHPSVEYICLVEGGGPRPCEPYEPPGTLVRPQCREPHYFIATPLPFMSCSDDGYWNYTARCSPECGKVTPDGMELVTGGQSARRGELPWHAGIYTTTHKPYLQICGGSLISNNLIISAAHCFWSDLEKQLPAEQFAVAVGKLYRPWDDVADDAQKSAVKEIWLSPRFQGSDSNFRDNIAVVVVAEAFEYKTYIQPVCLSFDINFERQQLLVDNKGKIAGWGLTSENGNPSPILQVVELPFVDSGTCLFDSPPDFRQYITSDKICTRTSSQQISAALCREDSGGGLSFPATNLGVVRYYLRGIVSTAPKNHACNATFTIFTQITEHEDFIKQLLKD